MPSRAVISAVFLLVAAVMLASALYRARGLRECPRPPDLVALVLTLVTLAVSFALQAPVARDWQNRIVTNLGQLLGNGTTLIAACMAIALVLFILHDPAEARTRLRPRLAALAAALLAMTVLFVANPTDAEKFTSPSAPVGIVVYYLVYLVYLAVALVDLLTLIRRYARRAPDRYLRIGMQIVAAGCGVGLVYMVGRTLNITLGYLGVDLAGRPDHRFGLLEFIIAAVLPSISVLLAVIGFTFRRWAPVVAQPAQWLVRRRFYRGSYRQMEPLWEAVHAVLPQIAFSVRDNGTRPRLRLYGRTVELNDAELVVKPYVDSRLRDDALAAAVAAGLSEEEAAATADAAVLAVGLVAVREDRPATPLVRPDRATEPALTEIDLAREAQRLERVSHAFVHSPIVQRFSQAAAATP